MGSLPNPLPSPLTIAPNPLLDLTTTTWVKAYAGAQTAADDSIIQLAVTGLSIEFLRETGRGPADGSVPTQNPFITPILYDETYDGSGTERQFVRNWPINRVVTLVVQGQTISQSIDTNSAGYVVDGSGKSIVMRRPAGYQYGRLARRYLGSTFVFIPGFQNVHIQYVAGFVNCPSDIIRAMTQWVAMAYKRKDWIDQRSLSLSTGGGGTGTTSYRDWDKPPEVRRLIRFYERNAIV